MSSLFSRKHVENDSVVKVKEASVPFKASKQNAVNEARIEPLIKAAQNVTVESVKQALGKAHKSLFHAAGHAVDAKFAGAKRLQNLKAHFAAPASTVAPK